MTATAPLIVIPCLNEAESLPDLIAQFTTENPDSPIVVADGGSTDGSRDIVTDLARRHPQVTLLDNPAKIQAAGINRAVTAFGGDRRWLVRIDAHCTYPPDYVARLLTTAETRGATSVVVPMVSFGTSCFQRAAAAAQNSVLGTGGSAHRHVGAGGFVDHGHHALMRLELFRAVDGYRADMSHNEDAELDHRLGLAGGRIWLEPALALGYASRRTPGALWRQYWRYGRGRARTVRLHGMRLKTRQLIPLAVPGAILLAGLAPWWPPACLPAAIWAAASLGAGIAVGARAGGGCALAAGAAAMVMHAGWGLGFVSKVFSNPVR